MKDEAYDALALFEREHWWYRSLRRSAAREAMGAGRVLDVGCGTADMARFLPWADYVGIDFSRRALGLAERSRGGRSLCRADACALPFADASFDLVLCLDVLYHEWVRDEVSALREMGRVLGYSGRLVLQVPAFERYRRAHDRSVMGARRYTSGEVAALVSEAGFSLVKIGYRNLAALFLAEVFRRWRNNPTTGDLSRLPRPLNAALDLFAKGEESVISLKPLPLGLSVWCVAEKPVQS